MYKRITKSKVPMAGHSSDSSDSENEEKSLCERKPVGFTAKINSSQKVLLKKRKISPAEIQPAQKLSTAAPIISPSKEEEEEEGSESDSGVSNSLETTATEPTEGKGPFQCSACPKKLLLTKSQLECHLNGSLHKRNVKKVIRDSRSEAEIQGRIEKNKKKKLRRLERKKQEKISSKKSTIDSSKI
eukprot:Sdes_comp16189_c0_seq1m5441